MQHAVAISGEEDDQASHGERSSSSESNAAQQTPSQPLQVAASCAWTGIKYLFNLLRPATLADAYHRVRQMTFKDMITNLFLLLIKCIRLL
ncbi:unnamed protein product, partial [Rotaria magnacalcarata]